jgi:hypothetical protein
MSRIRDASPTEAAFLSESQGDTIFRHGQDHVRSDHTAELLRKSPAARAIPQSRRRIH